MAASMASPLRQPSPQQESVSGAPSAFDAPGAQAGMQAKPNSVPLPLANLNAKVALFDAQRPTAVPSYVPVNVVPEYSRPSLFKTVTGALGLRNLGPAPAAQQPSIRREPEVSEYQPPAPTASVRQTSAGDEAGLEIPAFLRRQHS